jgi:psp operon transcriptional activator
VPGAGGAAGDDELRALPENLIEAELFGHEAGSFTGAAKTRHGRFEEADGGNLFLDELATCRRLPGPATSRGRIWRDYRIGASKRSRSMSASLPHQRTSAAAGRSGTVPADLLDRLSFEVVTLPPLRVRKGDIPVLAEHLGGEWRWNSNGPTGRASLRRRNARSRIIRGRCNVRELRNVVERAVYRHENPERPIPHIQFDPFQSPWVLGGKLAGASFGRSELGLTRPRLNWLPTICALAVNAYEKRCWKTRLTAIASTSAHRGRAGLSYDQLAPCHEAA